MSRLSKRTLCQYLFSIPKSLYVGFKLLPFKEAVRLKCLVKYNVKLVKISGLIENIGGGDLGSDLEQSASATVKRVSYQYVVNWY